MISDIMISSKRAEMPKGANKVLDRRSLQHDNKNILAILKENQNVLDVGCGSGSITQGIATIAKNGKVIGIDLSEHLIAIAKDRYAEIENLSFKCGNILDLDTIKKFDVVTAARTLQWIGNYTDVLLKMKSLLAEKGRMAVLDYNHEKIEWTPPLPNAMRKFYHAFLKWRADAGMNNAIGDDLKLSFHDIGLMNISVSDESEFTQSIDEDFYEKAVIWKTVAETRGSQMVRDGYVTEQERQLAINEYEEWLTGAGTSMKMYLTSTVGSVPA